MRIADKLGFQILIVLLKYRFFRLKRQLSLFYLAYKGLKIHRLYEKLIDIVVI